MRRARQRQAGQALVEFAIVVPVIVMMVLFAGWFYEFVQIKLKVQEAARYTAWEFTAYDLHDYAHDDDRSGALFDQARDAIVQDAEARYRDLNSTTERGANEQYMVARWEVRSVQATNQATPEVPGGTVANLLWGGAVSILNTLAGRTYSNPNPMAQTMIASAGLGLVGNGDLDRWRLNRKGFVHAKVRARVKNVWIPERVMGLVTLRDDEGLDRGWTRTFSEEHALIVDPWHVTDGSAVEGSQLTPGESPGKQFWKQVDRMAWLKPAAKAEASIVANAVRIQSSALVGLSLHLPLSADAMTTTLVSKPYGAGALGAAGGRITLHEDDGQAPYDTAPHTGAYAETRADRGPHFMGCPQAEMLGCTDTLAQDNPFGDYLHRPGAGE